MSRKSFYSPFFIPNCADFLPLPVPCFSYCWLVAFYCAPEIAFLLGPGHEHDDDDVVVVVLLSPRGYYNFCPNAVVTYHSSSAAKGDGNTKLYEKPLVSRNQAEQDERLTTTEKSHHRP